MFKPFYEAVSNVSETVSAHERRLGRPVIGVMPAYFPLELITAAGGFPVQLWGNRMPVARSDAYLQSYCCSVARSVLELELIGGAKMVKAYAFNSLCDTMINLREIYRRLFDKPTVSLSIPITGTEKARQDYLGTVLQSVTRGLEKITGKPITPESLADAARSHGRTRRLQRRLYDIRRQKPGLVSSSDFYHVLKAGFFLPPDAYNPMLENLVRYLETLSPLSRKRPRLVLSGMLFDPIALFKIMDEMAVDVVDDDFANGWRTVSKPDLKTENLRDGVTEFLFHSAPCCCIYNPENDRHPYLVDKARTAGADGVLFWYVKFCEPDAFDQPQLIRRLNHEGIRAAVMDVELSMTHFDAVRTRIAAFCEMLE